MHKKVILTASNSVNRMTSVIFFEICLKQFAKCAVAASLRKRKKNKFFCKYQNLFDVSNYVKFMRANCRARKSISSPILH